MASVQDENGVWWKRCMSCGEWVSYGDLMYEVPSEEFKFGRDVCASCAGTSDGEVVPQEFVVVRLDDTRA